MKTRSSAFLLACILCAHGLILSAMGRILWCASGDSAVWTGDAWTSHTSQHLFDPYSLSHVQHGIIFFFVLHLLKVAPRRGFWIACFIEIGWELLENSSFIINRYRSATASLDYFGDSIANSAGDILSCLLGFTLAARFPWKVTLAVYLAIEIGMLIAIRDSLALNVLMLLSPVAAIKQWQTAGITN